MMGARRIIKQGKSLVRNNHESNDNDNDDDKSKRQFASAQRSRKADAQDALLISSQSRPKKKERSSPPTNEAATRLIERSFLLSLPALYSQK
jgi:hypothetical protein